MTEMRVFLDYISCFPETAWSLDGVDGVAGGLHLQLYTQYPEQLKQAHCKPSLQVYLRELPLSGSNGPNVIKDLRQENELQASAYIDLDTSFETSMCLFHAVAEVQTQQL